MSYGVLYIHTVYPTIYLQSSPENDFKDLFERISDIVVTSAQILIDNVILYDIGCFEWHIQCCLGNVVMILTIAKSMFSLISM